jgi:hypothetical protein
MVPGMPVEYEALAAKYAALQQEHEEMPPVARALPLSLTVLGGDESGDGWPHRGDPLAGAPLDPHPGLAGKDMARELEIKNDELTQLTKLAKVNSPRR